MDDSTKERIAVLVEQLHDVGCELVAVGKGYVIDEPEDVVLKARMLDILYDFGPRLHLLNDISDYLRLLGRCLDV